MEAVHYALNPSMHHNCFSSLLAPKQVIATTKVSLRKMGDKTFIIARYSVSA
ncbi:hypothetical protein P692DRAFT_20910242 [Suillus brevipes Sb2]|nr:hypothetical protein P692DRAFT_20910242 [Suillus brevipes Sb2]